MTKLFQRQSEESKRLWSLGRGLKVMWIDSCSKRSWVWSPAPYTLSINLKFIFCKIVLLIEKTEMNKNLGAANLGLMLQFVEGNTWLNQSLKSKRCTTYLWWYLRLNLDWLHQSLKGLSNLYLNFKGDGTFFSSWHFSA